MITMTNKATTFQLNNFTVFSRLLFPKNSSWHCGKMRKKGNEREQQQREEIQNSKGEKEMKEERKKKIEFSGLTLTHCSGLVSFNTTVSSGLSIKICILAQLGSSLVQILMGTIHMGKSSPAKEGKEGNQGNKKFEWKTPRNGDQKGPSCRLGFENGIGNKRLQSESPNWKCQFLRGEKFEGKCQV